MCVCVCVCVCTWCLTHLLPLCDGAPLVSKKLFTSLSCTVILADMLLHYYEHTHTYTHTHTHTHTVLYCDTHHPTGAMWINPLLKIVPNTYTSFSCLSNFLLLTDINRNTHKVEFPLCLRPSSLSDASAGVSLDAIATGDQKNIMTDLWNATYHIFKDKKLLVSHENS